MNFGRCFSPLAVLILFVIIISVAVKPTREAFATAGKPVTTPTVIIDAGHGGFDGGAVAPDGTKEKDLNLNISLKLQEILTLYGFDAILTRTTDAALGGGKDSGTTKQNDLRTRVELMNSREDAVVVSIHQNKFQQSEVHGLQVFYNQNTQGAKALGEAIQNYVNENLQTDKPRIAKADTRHVQILEKSQNPTVIVECGFLSNPTDLENLKDEDYCYTLCFGIANGIINYMQGEENGSQD